MDKDKGLPPTGRYSVYSPPGSSYGAKPEASGSSSFPLSGHGGNPESGHFGLGMPMDSSRYSHDISRMPDNPPRSVGHRRAHSEILTLPDDISFDSDLGVVGGLDGPSFSDDTEEDLISMYLDINKFNSSSASAYQVDEVSSSAGVSCSPPKPAAASLAGRVDSAFGVSDKPRVRHSHSQSMDGSSTINSEMLTSGSEEPSSAEAKKAMSAAKLSELALIDPKRAKRVWANRQSAARSKERKMRYIAELERKVQTLQTEATSLSAQLTLLQRDTNGLTAENSELKLRLQTTEQQVHLQDALNDALKEEIQHLKTLTGQMIPNGGPMMNLSQSFGGVNQQQYYSNNNPSLQTMLTAQQFQQLQINSMKQQQPPRPFQQQHHQFQSQQQQMQMQMLLQQQQQQQHHQMQPQEQTSTRDSRLVNSIQSHAQNDDTPDMIGGGGGGASKD